MHPIWRRFWLAILRRESWVVILAAVALSVATVALSRPAPAPAPAQPALPPTPVPGPYHAPDNTPPGIFYPIAYLQQHPRRWVGKTVQISGGLNESCCFQGDAVFSFPIPDVAPNTDVPFVLFMDADNAASVLPLAPRGPLPMEAQGSGSGGYWRVHLAWWPHCGPLGFGKRDCLVADHLHDITPREGGVPPPPGW